MLAALRAMLLAAMVVTTSVYAQNAATYPVTYPAAGSSVSFDAVLGLPVGAPTSRFHYGPAPSQLAELWLPETITGTDAWRLFLSEVQRRLPLNASADVKRLAVPRV